MNKQKHRNWNVIKAGLATVRDHQQGTIDTYEGELTYVGQPHWHAEGCECPEFRFVAMPGYNSLHCPKCNLRLAVFVHMDKRGNVRDWSEHRQFDYSKQAEVEQELKFAARKPFQGELNSLGDLLSPVLQAQKAKDKAVENWTLVKKAAIQLEKDLLGSHIWHACMKEVPVLLAEARN